MSKEIVKKVGLSENESQPHDSLALWLRLQHSLAEKLGVTLAIQSNDNVVIGRVENKNSVCDAMQESPEHARLCAAHCGSAYSNAVKAGGKIEYRCHAGLQCFAIPVSYANKQLVIIGGKVFTSSYEYTQFLRRYGELDSVASGECLKNVLFLDSRALRAAAELVASTAELHFRGARESDFRPAEEGVTPPQLMDAHLEIITLSNQLDSKRRSIAQFYDFIRDVSPSLDSQKVYESVLLKFGEMTKSRRVSLMIFNGQTNELELESAVGLDAHSLDPVRVRLGEGVAGKVLASNTPLVVRDADTDNRIPPDRPGRYKSKSFISFPIVLGQRKLGVLNITERADGSPFRSDDLALLELMVPHLALIIDRTEWHRKAETYQRMSLTDPLTGLPNRRYLEERLFEEVERSKRHSTALSFMLIDVDQFKRYNDLYGHRNGDLVLVKTAHILRNSVRAIDMSARLAGDEFCVTLPETELSDAARIAERLRRTASQTEFRSEQGDLMSKVTISIGVSSFGPSRQSPLSIIEAADRALYRAKTQGRNCVAVYDDDFAVDQPR